MKFSSTSEKYKNTFTYTLYGMLFGFVFPFVATLFDIGLKDLSFTLASISKVQVTNHLHWIIDTAPIFLGLLAALAGYRKDEVEASNRELEQKVAQRTKRLESKNVLLKNEIESRKKIELALVKAKEVAEEAAKAKTQFLSTMSHEIRTPLNAVIGLSGLLVDTKLNNEQAEFVSTINKSGENLLGIINNILDYAKIESGKLELEEVELSIAYLIEDVLDIVSATNVDYNVELLYKIPETVPAYIIGDTTRIQQVLVNLVRNAIKFTDEGEIVISVDFEKSREEEQKLIFEVRDTGIGIPGNKLDDLFEKFSQVDASTTRKYGGTGLGLAICKRLVELMGGTISVSSEEGVGSAFTFSIDVKKSDKKELTLQPESLKGKKVFILDDNDTNLYILRAQCEKAGMSVTTYSNPLDVIAAADELKMYDLGILDMQMPKKNGVEVAEALRKVYSKTELPLVLLSSIMEMANNEQRHQFNLYLTKPIKQTHLLNNLARVFGNVTGILRSEEKEKYEALGVGRKLRILVAEDNIINQKVAGKMLERLGHVYDVAANGEEAIEMCRMIDYDMILMDMEMPVMDGLQATKELTKIKDELNKFPIIIAMTANAMAEDQKRCLDAGMKDFLAKPVTLQSMQEMFMTWFGVKN
tara:strand:+ start:12131 stop:14056 length:1926 start_codon:yes stop_codon:yes gene_type:complete